MSPDRTVLDLLPRLYAAARCLTLDRSRAEEAVQETVTAFLQSERKDPGRIRDPLAWCHRVLVRTLWKGRPPMETLPDEDSIPGSSPSPASALEREDARRQIREALAALPDEDRALIGLHVFGELPIREAAGSLGIPPSTAHERLQRGYASLRRSLAGAAAAGLIPAGLSDEGLAARLRRDPPFPVPDPFTSAATSGVAAASAVPLLKGGIPMAASLVLGAGAILSAALVLHHPFPFSATGSIPVGTVPAPERSEDNPIPDPSKTRPSSSMTPPEKEENRPLHGETPVEVKPAATSKDLPWKEISAKGKPQKVDRVLVARDAADAPDYPDVDFTKHTLVCITGSGSLGFDFGVDKVEQQDGAIVIHLVSYPGGPKEVLRYRTCCILIPATKLPVRTSWRKLSDDDFQTWKAQRAK